MTVAAFVLVAAHLASTSPADASTVPSPDVAPADVVAPPGSCAERAFCLQRGRVAVWPRAAVRFGYEAVQADDDVRFIGRNDGFRLDQLRLGVEASYGARLGGRVRVDAARLLGGGENDPTSPTIVGLVDAYVQMRPSPWSSLTLGQARMPTDREAAAERTTLVFATRSVASAGVAPGRGFAVQGLSPSRDLGFVVAAKPRLGPVVVEGAAAVGNGGGGSQTGDDDALPAAYLRVGASWDDVVGVAVGGRARSRLVGSAPAVEPELERGGFVEASLRVAGFDAAAMVHGAQTSFPGTFAPTDPNVATTGWGATAWLLVDEPLGVDLYGVAIGARASVLEPLQAFPEEPLVEGALGVRWDPPLDGRFPVAFILDLTTLASVDAAGPREFRNRAFLLAQLDL